MKRVEYLILCPRFPLLGFRLTAAVDGRAKIGPTALPASWREQYGGLRNFRVGELAEIRGCEAHLFVLDASFRELAAEALRKHSRRELIRLADALAEAIRFEAFTLWGKPGIRAQLLDTATSRLAMGFVTEHDDLILSSRPKEAGLSSAGVLKIDQGWTPCEQGAHDRIGLGAAEKVLGLIRRRTEYSRGRR